MYRQHMQKLEIARCPNFQSWPYFLQKFPQNGFWKFIKSTEFLAFLNKHLLYHVIFIRKNPTHLFLIQIIYCKVFPSVLFLVMDEGTRFWIFWCGLSTSQAKISLFLAFGMLCFQKSSIMSKIYSAEILTKKDDLWIILWKTSQNNSSLLCVENYYVFFIKLRSNQFFLRDAWFQVPGVFSWNLTFGYHPCCENHH